MHYILTLYTTEMPSGDDGSACATSGTSTASMEPTTDLEIQSLPYILCLRCSGIIALAWLPLMAPPLLICKVEKIQGEKKKHTVRF